MIHEDVFCDEEVIRAFINDKWAFGVRAHLSNTYSSLLHVCISVL